MVRSRSSPRFLAVFSDTGLAAMKFCELDVAFARRGLRLVTEGLRHDVGGSAPLHRERAVKAAHSVRGHVWHLRRFCSSAVTRPVARARRRGSAA